MDQFTLHGYTDIRSAAIVNGHIGLEFPVERSVRQGCSLSPMLYVLTMEPFAHQIRCNPHYKGLQLPESDDESCIIQFADDATFVITEVATFEIIFWLCEAFKKASGADVNLEKTCGIWLSAWKHRSDMPFGITWVTSEKLLGYMVGYGNK